MKKTLSILLALLLIAALLAGCGQKTPSAPAEDAYSAETADAGIYVTVNGQNLTVGVPYAGVQEKLGEETQPAETITSCDENSDWKQTMHFYEGLTVTEDKDGNIDGVQVSGGEYALMGKIKIGATKDEVKEVLGEPDTDAAWGLYYTSGAPWVNIYVDEETGLVSGFALMPYMN